MDKMVDKMVTKAEEENRRDEKSYGAAKFVNSEPGKRLQDLIGEALARLQVATEEKNRADHEHDIASRNHNALLLAKREYDAYIQKNAMRLTDYPKRSGS